MTNDYSSKLVLEDADWIPEGDGYSLYLRPTAISTYVRDSTARVFVVAVAVATIAVVLVVVVGVLMLMSLLVVAVSRHLVSSGDGGKGAVPCRAVPHHPLK